MIRVKFRDAMYIYSTQEVCKAFLTFCKLRTISAYQNMHFTTSTLHHFPCPLYNV